MRRNLLHLGASKLNYEIRKIVKVAHYFSDLGVVINWENIGDPIQKGHKIPNWMKSIVSDLVQDSESYSYSLTKGFLETREYLAKKTNKLSGVQITADDILFFNGLGDAIAKVYEYLDPKARVMVPSPAYSTHSLSEASHASSEPIVYQLDPENGWRPDLSKLREQIISLPEIVGVLIINPDNPTGLVYPIDVLQGIVDLAKEFDLFIVADEIYEHITYNGITYTPLSQIIGDVCGIAMKGISKEFPWPGSRCGWIEVYNKGKDVEFAALAQTLENVKMLEVCSTTLPQMSIPKIMEHSQFQPYREEENRQIAKRGDILLQYLEDLSQIVVNKTYGAFYNTIIFRKNTLNDRQTLTIENKKVKRKVEEQIVGVALDKRFVYYLLAKTGICVVPISSFSSDLLGFRVTLLEQDEKKLHKMYHSLRNSIVEYTQT